MEKKRVAFATCVWEKDWRQILLSPEYLPVKQIGNHCFDFSEKILVINNVNDLDEVIAAAEKWREKGVLTRICVAKEQILSFFGLKRNDFQNDWVYHNAMGPLTAIHGTESDYLLYMTGDVRVDERVEWIEEAVEMMEKEERYKVANLVWNGNIEEVKRESYRKKGPFYVARQGFSDQMFLVRSDLFAGPIYSEIRADSHHYPRGDVFEKRVFSFLKNRGWERITYRHGSYIHENF